MTLRIERIKGRIRLSGELRFGHWDQVKVEIERCESPVMLDLENWIESISKVFVFSMPVRRRACRSCTVRLTSGNECCRSGWRESATRSVNADALQVAKHLDNPAETILREAAA